MYSSVINEKLVYPGNKKYNFSNYEQTNFIREDKIAFCCRYECLTDEYACTTEALLDFLEWDETVQQTEESLAKN